MDYYLRDFVIRIPEVISDLNSTSVAALYSSRDNNFIGLQQTIK